MESESKRGDSCGFCGRGDEVENICGPIRITNTEDGRLCAHHKCMQYSALLIQYKFDNFGGFKIAKVKEELKRAKRLSCSLCKKKKPKKITGASAGCAYARCSKTFHFYCAKMDTTAVTVRMEQTDPSGKVMVLYRVFCGKEHMNKYSATSELGKLEAMSNSDDSGDEIDERSSDKDSPKPKAKSKPERASPPWDQFLPHRQVIRTLGTVKLADSGSDEDSDVRVMKVQAEVHPECVPKHISHTNTNVKAPEAAPMSPSSPSSSSSSYSSSLKRKAANGIDDSAPSSKKKNGTSNPSEDDLLMCITETRDKNTIESIRSKAKSLFGMDRDQVIFWCGGGTEVTSRQMMWYHADLVSALSKSTENGSLFKNFYNFIFSLSEDSIRKYNDGARKLQLDQGDPELERNISKMRMKDLQCKLEIMHDALSSKIAHVERDSTANTTILYILLTSITDPECQIRRTLVNSAYEWCVDVVLQTDEGATDRSRSLEFTVLKEKLRSEVSSARIFSYPCDEFLRVKQPDSVCGRLFRHFSRRLFEPNSRSLVVFVGPMDREILVYNRYIQRCIESVLGEYLCQSEAVYFVFDVGADLKVTKLGDILPDVDNNAAVTAWTAYDPSKDLVTCAVLKFTQNVG